MILPRLSEKVVVPTDWTTASDTAEAVATTVGAALVGACVLGVIPDSERFC